MLWSRSGVAVAWLTCALAVAGCHAPADAPSGAAGEQAPLPEAASTIRPAGAVDRVDDTGPAEYRLAAGDRIRLTTFRHEDLSGEFQLDRRGYFTMPLVGQIYAYGRTARQLENEVEIALRGGGYLVAPRVGIEVLNPRPVYVLGDVRAPGSYAYADGMTVRNAVRLAGGSEDDAEQGTVRLRRGGANARALEVPGDAALLPGDIIEVAERAS